MELSGPAKNDGGSYLVSGSLSLAHLCLILTLVALSYIKFFGATRGKALPGAPVVGPRSWLEPMFVTKYRFAISGWSIVYEGYTKAGSLRI